jgi:hypothetical protein
MQRIRALPVAALPFLIPFLISTACTRSPGPVRKPEPQPQAPAVFPREIPLVVLPIRHSVFVPDLAVQATVEGSGGVRAPVWMVVNSGASDVILPIALAENLGLHEMARRNVRTTTGSAVFRRAMVPGLMVADLVVSNIPAQLQQLPVGRGSLGQSVLSRVTWEVSWDQGTVTLGGTPWPEGADVLSLPLDPSPGGPDQLLVRINGHPVRMCLCTGVMHSTLPENTGIAFGLTSEPIEPPTVKDREGDLAIKRLFSGDIELGSWTVEGGRFAAVGVGQPALLGTDVLSHFNFQVIPAQRRLLLRRRGELRATAEARLGRWREMPSCPSPGCVQAQVEPLGKSGRLEIEVQAKMPWPARLVFGCAERRAPERFPWPVISGGQPTGPFHHLFVYLNLPKPGPLSRDVPDAAQLVTPEGTRCKKLVLLEISPMRWPAHWAGNDLTVSLDP